MERKKRERERAVIQEHGMQHCPHSSNLVSKPYCMAVVLLLTASSMSHSFYMQHAVIEATVLEVCACTFAPAQCGY